MRDSYQGDEVNAGCRVRIFVDVPQVWSCETRIHAHWFLPVLPVLDYREERHDVSQGI